jgi:hypothetical protein
VGQQFIVRYSHHTMDPDLSLMRKSHQIANAGRVGRVQVWADQVAFLQDREHAPTAKSQAAIACQVKRDNLTIGERARIFQVL